MSRNTLKSIFVKGKHYEKFPASGVWGGISPDGNIVAEFFFENLDIPDHLVLEIDEKGVGLEIGRDGEDMIRTVQSAFVMSPATAYAVGKWLMSRAEDAGYRE